MHVTADPLADYLLRDLCLCCGSCIGQTAGPPDPPGPAAQPLHIFTTPTEAPERISR